MVVENVFLGTSLLNKYIYFQNPIQSYVCILCMTDSWCLSSLRVHILGRSTFLRSARIGMTYSDRRSETVSRSSLVGPKQWLVIRRMLTMLGILLISAFILSRPSPDRGSSTMELRFLSLGVTVPSSWSRDCASGYWNLIWKLAGLSGYYDISMTSNY